MDRYDKDSDLKSGNQPEQREAFSYLRFSHRRQEAGDSLRRQLALSDDYVKKHNLRLNRTLTDKGIPSFRGQNLQKGALGAFIKAIQLGKVKPGSVLLVEALDRLSRNQILHQLTLFLQILAAGIEIVTLCDGRSYTQESINGNPVELIISIVLMIRGWNESETKSQRVKEAWDAKRKKAHTSRLTSACPGWLQPGQGPHAFEIVPGRGKIVRLVFWLTSRGWSAMRICQLFNRCSLPCWSNGKTWNSTYIRNLLRNRAVLGEFQPKRRKEGDRREPVGHPVPNYYPAVVPEPLFLRVQRLACSTPRANKLDCIGNLFTGFVFDGNSGATMRIHHAGSDEAQAVLRSSAIERGMPSNTWNYSLFEASVLENLEQLDWDNLLFRPVDERHFSEKRRLETQLENVNSQIKRVVDFVAANDLHSCDFANKIKELELERQSIKDKLEHLTFVTNGSDSEGTELCEARTRFMELVAKGDAGSRRLLRAEMKILIKRIDLWADPAQCSGIKEYYPLLAKAVQTAGLQWEADPKQMPKYRITFSNGTERWVICEGCRLPRRGRCSSSNKRHQVRDVIIALPPRLPSASESE
jgi:DNA invertase Pin-like site-specific DNA recombinase